MPPLNRRAPACPAQIDVESMELLMLQGAKTTIAKFRPIVFVEDSEIENMMSLRAPTEVMKYLYQFQCARGCEWKAWKSVIFQQFSMIAGSVRRICPRVVVRCRSLTNRVLTTCRQDPESSMAPDELPLPISSLTNRVLPERHHF